MTPGQALDRERRAERWDEIERLVAEARDRAMVGADLNDMRDPLHETERLLIELQGKLRDLRLADARLR